ncbi:hypothetical protein E4U55_007972 [Claviceps digitariae]|nr:hypothetical protein E4U55_007972 [Claviceps digitariae]
MSSTTKTIQQPNFSRAAGALRTLTHEVELMPNFEPMTIALTLQKIFSELSSFRENVNSRFDALDEKVGALDQRVGALEKRVGDLEVTMEKRFTAVEARLTAVEGGLSSLQLSVSVNHENTLSIVHNARIENQGLQLYPLYSPLTGRLIHETSVKSADLNKMDETVLNGILEQLGRSTEGDIFEKRRRVKCAMGVRGDRPEFPESVEDA